MYSLFEPGARITLWCDGVDEKENLPPTKKKWTEGSSEKSDSSEQTSVNKRDSAEVEPKNIVEQLKMKHPIFRFDCGEKWFQLVSATTQYAADTRVPSPSKTQERECGGHYSWGSNCCHEGYSAGKPSLRRHINIHWQASAVYIPLTPHTHTYKCPRSTSFTPLKPEVKSIAYAD